LSRNLGTLTFWNPLGHPRPVTELLYLFLKFIYLFNVFQNLYTGVHPMDIGIVKE
jgi:hypothetical protein